MAVFVCAWPRGSTGPSTDRVRDRRALDRLRFPAQRLTYVVPGALYHGQASTAVAIAAGIVEPNDLDRGTASLAPAL